MYNPRTYFAPRYFPQEFFAGIAILSGSAGITSGETFGAGGSVNPLLVGAAGIVSALAFGTGGKVVANITGYFGIPSALAFGNSGVVLGIPGSGTGPSIEAGPGRFTLFVGGVNKSSYLQVNPPVEIDAQMSQRTTAHFTLFDKLGIYRPTRGQRVLFFEMTDLIFSGVIVTIEESWTSGSPHMYNSVRCADLGSILDHRVVGYEYNVTHGILNVIVGNIVANFLDGEGLSVGAAYSDVVMTTYQKFLFNWITVREAFDELAKFFQRTWNIDPYGVITFGSTATFPAAPFSVADNDGLWRNMLVTRTSDQYFNRVGVRSSINLLPVRTDTFAGVATGFYITAYLITVKPIVKVNGVSKTVLAFFSLGTAPYDFYWIDGPDGGFGVFQNPTHAALSGSDVVTVTYPSSIPNITFVQDDAEIAARAALEGGSGKWERVFDVRDTVTQAQAISAADGILAKSLQAVLKIQFEVTTHSNPLSATVAPGQLININTTQPLVPNSDYLIEAVQSVEVDKQWMHHAISCVGGDPMGGPANVFYRLLGLTKEPIDRIRQNLTFFLQDDTLAVGSDVTNRPFATKPGYAMIASAYVFPAPTGADAIFDILDENGDSIFGTDKLTVSDGDTSGSQVFFVDDPFVVDIGDVYFLSVLQVGSTIAGGRGTVTISLLA